LKTQNIDTPLDAYLKFLWQVSEKDFEGAIKTRCYIKMNRYLTSGKDSEKWQGFYEITGQNNRFRKMKLQQN
tara:strand:- start:497 stop:712 length:216 start_codon:yes stop_codon:yes gene_type:complete